MSSYAVRAPGDVTCEVSALEQYRLTAREIDVLQLLTQGGTARQIGFGLRISERTVHKHLEHIYAKLDCRDRLGAVLTARQTGLT